MLRHREVLKTGHCRKSKFFWKSNFCSTFQQSSTEQKDAYLTKDGFLHVFWQLLRRWVRHLRGPRARCARTLKLWESKVPDKLPSSQRKSQTKNDGKIRQNLKTFSSFFHLSSLMFLSSEVPGAAVFASFPSSIAIASLVTAWEIRFRKNEWWEWICPNGFFLIFPVFPCFISFFLTSE